MTATTTGTTTTDGTTTDRTSTATPPATTNDAGIAAPSDEYSLSAGPGGPLLLADHHLIQKMAQFNRERVPERVVHANGGGAFGHFEALHDVSRFTRAEVFAPGTVTPMLARFSTVAGERGAADTMRDPRGFSLKFYTEQGNWDMVGNNTPVFFMRDPSKFQDFIHSQKRRADSFLRDNNMQWDYWSLSPESAHQVTWLMGDRGLPSTWREMNGYSSHTYSWMNAGGERFWVKYHFKTDQGIGYMTQADGDAMAGQDSEHHKRDLREHIARGDFPSWTLHVQVMPLADAADYRFNPFDLTKTWPHGDYPLIPVGRMVLDRNPDNYFSQIESASFDVSNVVPGMGFSPDKMLQARVFSYSDAHRYRVGANYLQLPVNQPRAAVHSYNRDGAMRYTNPGDPVYAPNSYGGPAANPPAEEVNWWVEAGEIVRSAYVAHREDDDFGQAGTMVREVLDDGARERLVTNIVGHVGDGVVEPVLGRTLDYWRNVDADLGARVEKGLAGS